MRVYSLRVMAVGLRIERLIPRVVRDALGWRSVVSLRRHGFWLMGRVAQPQESSSINNREHSTGQVFVTDFKAGNPKIPNNAKFPQNPIISHV
jgi:hypothetical protein